MLYKATAKGKAALADGETFVKKDAKGRKSMTQRGHVVKAVTELQPAATKAAIVKKVRFQSKAKSGNVGYYLVKLQAAGFIVAAD